MHDSNKHQKKNQVILLDSFSGFFKNLYIKVSSMYLGIILTITSLVSLALYINPVLYFLKSLKIAA